MSSPEEAQPERRIVSPSSAAPRHVAPGAAVSFSGASGSIPAPISGPQGRAAGERGPHQVSEPQKDRVVVFDTTLRDGEQSPGASMNLSQKLKVATALRDLGVDVIEAGFAAASPGDLEAIQAVARKVEGAVICSLARCNRADIEAACTALADAPRRRIHVFLATSPIHREFKLKMAREEIVRRAVESVKLARERCDDVEFSAEDAARTELGFLAEVVERAIEAGATTVNIPDTVGYMLPQAYGETLTSLRQHVRGIDRVVLSVHCHDDLGLAVANSITGVLAGARQVECTVNGIGERAGNASLEEIVMAIKVRHDILGVHHRHPHRAPLPHEPPALADHRPLRLAPQGHRRPERLRPRGRHPPARDADEPRDLRDHAPRGRGLQHELARHGQALRPPRPAPAPLRPGVRPGGRPARRGVRRVQAALRQEEGDLRRRSRRPWSSTASTSTRSGAPGRSRPSPPPAAPAPCRWPPSPWRGATARARTPPAEATARWTPC